MRMDPVLRPAPHGESPMVSPTNSTDTGSSHKSAAKSNPSEEQEPQNCSPFRELSALFECPSCFESVLPLVNRCQNGHIICQSCLPNLVTCPTCNSSLHNNIRRIELEDFDSTSPEALLEMFIEWSPLMTNSSHYNTLLDLYLRSHKLTTDLDRRSELWRKIMTMLKTPEADYDINHALILCKLHNFDDGLLCLYEKLELYSLINRYHMTKRDPENVITCCQDFGNLQPTLWREALTYFSENEGTTEQVLTVLEQVERHRLMSAVSVVEVLSQNSSLSLTVILDFLFRFLTREAKMVDENDQLVNRYKDETERIGQAIEDIKTKPKEFLTNKCTSCNGVLELPSVHFLCGHSYHQHCFEECEEESNSECPVCCKKNAEVLEQIRSQESAENLHIKFTQLLANEHVDAISAISSFFSKGIFNQLG